MRDLAKSGNIGRIAVTDVDFTNSFTSGETSVGFFAEPSWSAVAKNFPITRLTKQAGMTTFLYQSGFAVMKNRPNRQATLGFINFAISPAMKHAVCQGRWRGAAERQGDHARQPEAPVVYA